MSNPLEDMQKPDTIFAIGTNMTECHPVAATGLKKALTKEKRWYIGEVREGSPGHQAGILPFDEILSINSVPLAFWELEQLFKLLRSEEGREIQFELRRYVNNDLNNFSDIKASFVLKKQL